MAHAEASYAAALLATVQDNPPLAQAYGDLLQDYAGAMQHSPELRSFLQDPIVPAAAKKDVLSKLSSPPPTGLALNFLRLLVDKRRVCSLPKISEEYQNQLAEMLGELVITISVAQPLPNEEIERIRAYFAKQYGAAHTRVALRIEPGLIGGINVQVGDMLYQGSVSGRLARLRSAIYEQIG